MGPEPGVSQSPGDWLNLPFPRKKGQVIGDFTVELGAVFLEAGLPDLPH